MNRNNNQHLDVSGEIKTKQMRKRFRASAACFHLQGSFTTALGLNTEKSGTGQPDV